MAQDVIMPQMGESIAEGTITTWLKKVGDHVERDEPLFEISTDKVDAEIPSPASGVLLDIKVQPGQTVAINTVVAVIGEAGSATASAPAVSAASTPAAPVSAPLPAAPVAASASSAPATASVDELRKTKSSPLVRKIAAEHQVDIASIEGTGLSGRVTKSDILAHLDHKSAQVGAQASAQAPAAAKASAPMAASYAASAGEFIIPEAYRAKVFEGDRVEEMSPMRSKIAEHMVLSRRISAHVATVFDVDFTNVAKLRAKYKNQWEERHQVNLTYTAFIMKVAVDALKAFPALNASLDGNKVIYHKHVNLGLAVALDWGLLVPVIHQADELNTLGLARRAADLAARARTKKLKPDEVQAGTFTITNPGIYGPVFGLPVINQPQVAIMGVGGVEKRPVVIDDMIAIRTKAYMSLSFDHRLIDGATADQFMARIKKGIEEFDESAL